MVAAVKDGDWGGKERRGLFFLCGGKRLQTFISLSLLPSPSFASNPKRGSERRERERRELFWFIAVGRETHLLLPQFVQGWLLEERKGI